MVSGGQVSFTIINVRGSSVVYHNQKEKSLILLALRAAMSPCEPGLMALSNHLQSVISKQNRVDCGKRHLTLMALS